MKIGKALVDAFGLEPGDVDRFPRIRLHGEDYILVDDAITTPDRYMAFADSYAHIYGDGVIRRYGHAIGTLDDIEYL